ncbi:MAG: 30S ribosomal protein S9 [Candidatus Moranbacteria bacterium]|nr:30S ribosomal protein S9 [Candidatus Moranbacteria bacterium]
MSTEKYFQAVGRRKVSVARVRLFDLSEEKSEGKKEANIEVNGADYKKYFPLSELREIVKAPLKAVSADIAKITVQTRGGGIRGQAEATRLGISRALVVKDGELKKTLKDLGYLTRDARQVERKKSGLKKARRAPQFSKR